MGCSVIKFTEGSGDRITPAESQSLRRVTSVWKALRGCVSPGLRSGHIRLGTSHPPQKRDTLFASRDSLYLKIRDDRSFVV
jgi:hypothetical protein